MAEKAAKTGLEVQLGFGFFADVEPTTIPAEVVPPRGARTGTRPRGLAEMLAAARTVLLEVPITDVSAQLLPLLEFCEAALTRALDVVPLRGDVPFSAEEYRSLRGIGQVQWLLAEEHRKREEKPVVSRRKRQAGESKRQKAKGKKQTSTQSI